MGAWNRKTERYGILFDSLTEANHYLVLRERQDNGEITDLECQPKYEIIPRQTPPGKKAIAAVIYTPDFRYRESGQVVVEEVKQVIYKIQPNGKRKKKRSTITEASQLRAKMLQYRYPEIDFRMVIYEEVA